MTLLPDSSVAQMPESSHHHREPALNLGSYTNICIHYVKAPTFSALRNYERDERESALLSSSVTTNNGSSFTWCVFLLQNSTAPPSSVAYAATKPPDSTTGCTPARDARWVSQKNTFPPVCNHKQFNTCHPNNGTLFLYLLCVALTVAQKEGWRSVILMSMSGARVCWVLCAGAVGGGEGGNTQHTNSSAIGLRKAAATQKIHQFQGSPGNDADR